MVGRGFSPLRRVPFLLFLSESEVYLLYTLGCERFERFMTVILLQGPEPPLNGKEGITGF